MSSSDDHIPLLSDSAAVSVNYSPSSYQNPNTETNVPANRAGQDCDYAIENGPAEKAQSVISHDDDGVSIERHIHVDDYSSKTTNLETLMHLLKGMVGTGILAMPVAFKNGGLWLSFVCVFMFGIIATHCMYLLVVCGNELALRTKAQHLDYASVMEKAFETRSDRWSKYSKAAKNFVNTFLLITQFGFCCVYIVFVAQNVKQVVQHTYPHTYDDKIYILIVSACLVPYFMVKSLKTLAIFTTFANVLNSVGLVIIFINLFQGLPDVSSRPAVAKISTFPLFFGQAVFAFEGIGLVLPMHEKMRDRAAFLGKAGVLNLGLTITICLYAAMGFYGYLKFGDQSAGSVTLNLPSDNWLYLSVKLMFAVSLFISCGLQFYVPVIIIWPFLVKKFNERSVHLPAYTEYVFRLLLLCVISGFSVLVPHLDLLISLVGAFASSFLAFIFPPIIEFVTFQPSMLSKVKNITIILIGFIGFVTGTYASMRDIIKKF